MESCQGTVDLSMLTRETELPAPIVISEVPITEGAGPDENTDSTVTKPAAELSAPESRGPGQVELSPPTYDAGTRDASAT